MKRRLLAVLLSCVLLAGLGAEAHANRAKKPFVFTTVTLEGKDISSEELFRDHAVTLIHVWATWCEPYIEELEELSKLHTRLQTCGCGIVGILWDGDTAQEEGRVIAEEKKLSFPILLPCEEMGALTEITVFPTTFFVDPEGRPVAEPAQNPRPDTEGEGEPATTEDYPSCPIVPVYVSETEVRIRAAGEYAGADGKDPPVP